MKKSILFGLILSGTLLLGSCNTRRAAIDDLSSLAERIELYGVSYDMDDWKMVLKEYAGIEKRLKKHDYTQEEVKEIGQLKGTLLGNAVKSVITSSKNKIDNINSLIDGGFEGFLESLFEGEEQ